jgi:hypothetical protein
VARLFHQKFTRLYTAVTVEQFCPPSGGSGLYNLAGWAVLLLPAIIASMAFGLVRIFDRHPDGQLPTALAKMGAAAVFGTWVAGGPDFLLNKGLAAFLLLLWFVRWRTRAQASRHSSAAEGADGRAETFT